MFHFHGPDYKMRTILLAALVYDVSWLSKKRLPVLQ